MRAATRHAPFLLRQLAHFSSFGASRGHVPSFLAASLRFIGAKRPFAPRGHLRTAQLRTQRITEMRGNGRHSCVRTFRRSAVTLPTKTGPGRAHIRSGTIMTRAHPAAARLHRVVCLSCALERANDDAICGGTPGLSAPGLGSFPTHARTPVCRGRRATARPVASPHYCLLHPSTTCCNALERP